MGLTFTIKNTLYFVDESNIWTMQHQWRAARLYQGRRPFPRMFKKVVKKVLKICYFREKQVFVGLRSSPSFFYTKQLSKSTSEGPPGRPLFNFFGRWIFTRYSEIVTFSIWGPSGRPADRARAGAFSGTLSRPFFVKPWGDFDGNPQLILTIPFGAFLKLNVFM